MFKCDQFIYIQMQKTASRHIVTLLQKLFDGQVIGTHNCATAEQASEVRYVFSSMRNPWAWYLSLWSFGVQQRGAVWRRLTQKQGRDLLREIYQQPAHVYQLCADFLAQDAAKWRQLYHCNDDAAAFRRWLACMHAPRHAHLLSREYRSSRLCRQVGFMTYRYLRLCCRLPEWRQSLTDCPALDLPTLKRFAQQHCYIDYFIQQENLEASFMHAVERIRTLSAAEKQWVHTAPKLNVSERALPLAAYYDQASLDLVAQREQLLIEKFNYSRPDTLGMPDKPPISP